MTSIPAAADHADQQDILLTCNSGCGASWTTSTYGRPEDKLLFRRRLQRDRHCAGQSAHLAHRTQFVAR